MTIFQKSQCKFFSFYV